MTWGRGSFDIDKLLDMRRALAGLPPVVTRITCAQGMVVGLKTAAGVGAGAGRFGAIPVYGANQFPFHSLCPSCGATGDGSDHPREPRTYCVSCRGGGSFWTDGMMSMSDGSMRPIVRYHPPRFAVSWPADIKVPLRCLTAQDLKGEEFYEHDHSELP